MKTEFIGGVEVIPVDWKDGSSCSRDCYFGSGVNCNVYSCLSTKRRDKRDVFYVKKDGNSDLAMEK